jgi:hypothetical protein
MTSSLPAEVQQVFDGFITCEYTTIGARKQPIIWPVTPYYEPGAPSIDVTTGLGYPKKADDARRHPSVSLLFSDPTGSGMERPPQVLVQGTAKVDERDLEANRERYWRESNVKLPGIKAMHPPAPIRRRLFGWYYARIYVLVRPERVFIWPEGDVTREPEIHDARLDEVRSGHTEEPPEEHGSALGGEVVWNRDLEQLGDRYPAAALSWLAPDGFPASVRLPVRADPDSRSIRIEGEPAGVPLLEGRACLTAHVHAPDLKWQRNFQVRGDLARGSDGWRLIPHRLVGDFELPEGAIARARGFITRMVPYYRTARRRARGRST